MVEPPLKWAGGKRWLVRRFPNLFSLKFDRYIEPFVGSGAVYFHLSPGAAILADKNTELMNLYSSLKADPTGLLGLMRVHAEKHSKSHYYEVRASQPTTRLERAARFLYLNRTCWNGLYRENRKGEFNVPIGTKNSVLFADETFELVAKLLSGAELSSGDFSGVLEVAGAGDLVFVDPPYTVSHNNNGFIKYNEQIFSWADQERLSACISRAADRGANIIITNALHNSVLDLYSGIGTVYPIQRQSVLSGVAAARGAADEAIFLVGSGLEPAAVILGEEVRRMQSLANLTAAHENDES